MPNQIFSSRSVPAVRFFIHLALLLLLCGSTIGQQYFPEGVFDDEKQANDSIVDQYSRYLKALQEPSLWETSKRTKGPVYRFLWLRSFDHPIVVRLNVNGDGTGTLSDENHGVEQAATSRGS